MTVHLDLSELIAKPIRSGIQRVERELLRHWPGQGLPPACWYDPERAAFAALPEPAIRVLCADAPAGGMAAEQALLRPFLRDLPIVQPEKLLCAELFTDPARLAFYREGRSEAYWLVYDFLPWLDPGWFPVGSTTVLMPFLRTMRAVPHLAFISARTRAECVGRILRRPCPGPVIPLGGDGLRLARQRFNPAHRSFVMLGAVEPRKNAVAVMRAFQMLWAQGEDVDLVLIGRLDDAWQAEAAMIDSLRNERRFRHAAALPDDGVRRELGLARAVLFPSGGEGFGLPPLEALQAGIPVIVSDGIPSLADLGSHGQIRLSEVTPETIAGAVQQVLQDEVARSLWAEAAQVIVPGWGAFASAVAAWVEV